MSKFGCHHNIIMMTTEYFRCQHSAFNVVLVVSSHPNMDRIEDRLLMNMELNLCQNLVVIIV